MIDIDFVTGIERDARFPKYLAASGLTHRFAIVQQTYVEGAGEMVVDERLWLALVAFVGAYAPDTTVTVAAQVTDVGRNERPLSDYVAEWEAKAPADRDHPPGAVVLRNAQGLVLCMLTEEWYSVGGPGVYHDSCTYSLFSGCDIADQVLACLRDHPDAAGWRLAETVLSAEASFEMARQGKRAAWIEEARIVAALVLGGAVLFAAWRVVAYLIHRL